MIWIPPNFDAQAELETLERAQLLQVTESPGRPIPVRWVPPQGYVIPVRQFPRVPAPRANEGER